MELIALSAPWILLLILVAAIGAFAFKKWKVAVPLLLVVLIGNWYFETLPLNVVGWLSPSRLMAGSQRMNETSGCLKVMSFNCNLSRNHADIKQRRKAVAKFIRQQDADIVFLAENFILKNDSVWQELQCNYPYHSQTKRAVGNCIYSKYPILSDTTYREKGKGYGITFCQINHLGQSIDVYGVHLSSNNYNEHREYITPDSVGTREQARSYLRQIVAAAGQRENEARIIVECMQEGSVSPMHSAAKSSHVPTIVMGDFNDVSGSPTIKILQSAGLTDAWWEGGFGYGATIHHPLPFRIDHIMHNSALELLDIQKINCNSMSDHDALVGIFKLP